MWEIETSEYLHRSPFASLLRKMVRGFRGDLMEFFYLDLADFCNVIPVTAAGEIVMVRQYRIGVEKHTLEIPGGTIDSSDENPQASAMRELREESGYGLAPGGKILSLGWAYPNPALQGNRCHFFACGPVERQGEIANDPNELTETVLVPINELRRRMRDEQLNHALMLNAFLFLELGQTDGRCHPFEALLHDLAKGKTE